VNTPTDLFGQELAVGDTVALMRPQYRELCLAKIIKITAKTVLVEYEHHYAGKREFRSDAGQLIKKPN